MLHPIDNQRAPVIGVGRQDAQSVAYTNLLQALARRKIYLGTTTATMNDAGHQAAKSVFPLLEVDGTGIGLPQEIAIRSIVQRGADHIAWHLPIHDMRQKRPFETPDWQVFIQSLLANHSERHTLLLSLDRTIEYASTSLDSLEEFRDQLPGLRFLIETNHRSWKSQRVQQLLQSLKWNHVYWDAPDLPGLVKHVEYHSSSVGYLRVLGRNAYDWFDQNTTTRFTYNYSALELQEIANSVRRLRDEHDHLFVSFCNRPAENAIQNVLGLAHLLI